MAKRFLERLKPLVKPAVGKAAEHVTPLPGGPTMSLFRRAGEKKSLKEMHAAYEPIRDKLWELKHELGSGAGIVFPYLPFRKPAPLDAQGLYERARSWFSGETRPPTAEKIRFMAEKYGDAMGLLARIRLTQEGLSEPVHPGLAAARKRYLDALQVKERHASAIAGFLGEWLERRTGLGEEELRQMDAMERRAVIERGKRKAEFEEKQAAKQAGELAGLVRAGLAESRSNRSGRRKA